MEISAFQEYRWWLLRMFVYLLSVMLVAAIDPLAYRDRGDRYEGVRSKPVGGYDIELLATMVELPEAWPNDLPERLSIHFFLERDEKVFLTVRERNPETYYWLDHVEPQEPWRPKATNVFTWPSRDVLQPLARKGLEPSGLLALVRLGSPMPARLERVAPVAFQSSSPRDVTAYRFTFKTNGAAKIEGWIQDDADHRVAAFPMRRHEPAIPFDFHWRVEGHPEGNYRLVLSGYFLSNNDPVAQEVELFHTSPWPG